jgi:hypothetical protein
MRLQRVCLCVFFLLLPAVLLGQGPTLAVNAASIKINPVVNDSYDITGSVSGFTLTGASFVSLTVGNFSASIPTTSFVQQPGTNVFVYQDTTGQAPGWVSSLTLNLDAQTFEAQAPNIVLAGLSNPFAVRLGTDQGSACTMVRVQQVSAGSYQLTPGDPAGMTCELAQLPDVLPDVFQAGAATSVTFQVFPATLAAGATQNLQLFRADDNAQPIGDPLCALAAQTDGSFACTAAFNEANPGMIPLLVQATAGGQTVLSPGFALQVVGPPNDHANQQFTDIENAMSQVWPSFLQFGDTAYPRVQALAALRTLMSPPMGLTGQPVGLSIDGLSIYVRSDLGMPVVLGLSDLVDMLPGLPVPAVAAPQVAAARPSRTSHVAGVPVPLAAPGRRLAPAASSTPMCGDFAHDIVANNKVLVWSPGDLFGFVDYQAIAATLQGSKCPSFQVFDYTGNKADVDSLRNFPQYGTIIMNSHGDVDHARALVLTGESATIRTINPLGGLSGEGTVCVIEGCYRTVYANHPNIQPLQNTIVYGGFCYSFGGKGSGSFSHAFAPPLSNSTYFGYTGSSPPIDDFIFGVPLFKGLLNQYLSTSEAYQDVIDSLTPDPDSSLRTRARKGSRDVCIDCLPPPDSPAPGAHFAMWNDPNLAYVGNPQITVFGQSPLYVVPMLGSLTLRAQLDGTDSCISNMQMNWTNTGAGGHLTPLGGSGQDNFSTTNIFVNYTALALLPPPDILPIDNTTVDFLPDPNLPAAARGCTKVAPLPPDQILHVVFDGSGRSSYTYPKPSFSGYQGSANVSWHYSWDIHIPFFQGVERAPAGGSPVSFEALVAQALPGTTVTGMTSATDPVSGAHCEGEPTIQGNIGVKPWMGVGLVPENQNAPYPLVICLSKRLAAGRIISATATK